MCIWNRNDQTSTEFGEKQKVIQPVISPEDDGEKQTRPVRTEIN